MRFTIVFFLLFLFGCGYEPIRVPANVEISSNLPPYVREVIEESFLEINIRAKETMFIFDETKKANITVDINSLLPQRKLLGTATISGGHCRIDIADNIIFSEDIIKLVVWHEVGHCLGLEHDLNYGEIMYNGPQRFSAITEEAKERFIEKIK